MFINNSQNEIYLFMFICVKLLQMINYKQASKKQCFQLFKINGRSKKQNDKYRKSFQNLLISPMKST